MAGKSVSADHHAVGDDEAQGRKKGQERNERVVLSSADDGTSGAIGLCSEGDDASAASRHSNRDARCCVGPRGNAAHGDRARATHPAANPHGGHPGNGDANTATGPPRSRHGATPDGAYLVLAVPSETGERSRLEWYEARTLSPVAPPAEIQGSRVLFSPDGRFMAVSRSGLGEDHLEIRRAEDGRVVQTVAGFFYGIHALAFSPDGHLLAMANDNATVRLVEVKSGLVLYELTVLHQGVHAALAQDVAFSPDGELVGGAAYGGTVQVWRTFDGSPPTTVQTSKPPACESWQRSISLRPTCR